MSESSAAPAMPRAEADGNPAALREAFLAAFRHHPAGVAIVTADAGHGPVALTVSSLISVSVEPPTVAFSLSERSSGTRTLRQVDTVVIHFVRRRDMDLARLCATSGADRFGPGIAWARLPTGEPYYPQVHHWFRAALRGRLDVPGASLVTAEMLAASNPSPHPAAHAPLIYADRGWHELLPIVEGGRAPVLLWPDDSATF